VETRLPVNDFQPYSHNTRRQFRHILFAGLAKWLLTVTLCVVYIVVTVVWIQKGKSTAMGEGQKRIYNAITTGISIALSLNIGSAFKGMALNMRWPILHMQSGTLEEVGSVAQIYQLFGYRSTYFGVFLDEPYSPRG